jgi:hypothetical protein
VVPEAGTAAGAVVGLGGVDAALDAQRRTQSSLPAAGRHLITPADV